MTTTYRYNTVETFLASHPLTVDVTMDDGWGASFPIKGIELHGTVLFADISGFSRRTLDFSPVETLAFVNNFFAWISAEALKDRPCIIDKYMGDEVMVIFAKEFGSDDPFAEAVDCARWMSERDALAYYPHVGIASGEMVVGYVGTPLKYDASVFGSAVALAARCASIKAPQKFMSSYITFPAAEWGERQLDDVLPRRRYKGPEGQMIEQPQAWTLKEPREVEMKNVGTVEVRQLINGIAHLPQMSAEERARECVRLINEASKGPPDPALVEK